MISRRRGCITLTALLLGGCAGFGAPRALHIDEAEAQSHLARQFPIRRRVFGVFELRLTSPKLRLLPQTNRLATAVDLTVGNDFDGRAVAGRIEIEYGLHYDPEAAVIRLVQPRVLQFDLARGRLRQPALLNGLIEAALDRLVLYQVSAERVAALRAAGLRPSDITVTAHGLDLRLEPVP